MPSSRTDDAMTPVSHDSPLWKAWVTYCNGDDYRNSERWARNPDHTQGALWAAFVSGFQAATPVVPSSEDLDAPGVREWRCQRCWTVWTATGKRSCPACDGEVRLIARAEDRERSSTHHAECWRERGHHACAIARLTERAEDSERLAGVVDLLRRCPSHADDYDAVLEYASLVVPRRGPIFWTPEDGAHVRSLIAAMRSSTASTVSKSSGDTAREQRRESDRYHALECHIHIGQPCSCGLFYCTGCGQKVVPSAKGGCPNCTGFGKGPRSSTNGAPQTTEEQ